MRTGGAARLLWWLRDHARPYCPGAAFGDKSTLTKHANHVHLKIPHPRRRPK
jgi:hypothetical protein